MSAETVQLDSSHCRAICDEIGERLRMILGREAAPLPPRLQLLMERLVEQDLVQSPSIAPSLTRRHGRRHFAAGDSAASRKDIALLDNVVGQQLQRARHDEAEGSGSLEVNDEFVFERELDR